MCVVVLWVACILIIVHKMWVVVVALCFLFAMRVECCLLVIAVLMLGGVLFYARAMIMLVCMCCACGQCCVCLRCVCALFVCCIDLFVLMYADVV